MEVWEEDEVEQRTGDGTARLEEGRLVAMPACPRAVNGAANWDLCTLAVFSCSRGCCSSPSSSPGTFDGGAVPNNGKPAVVEAVWEEEQVFLVNEDDVELPVQYGKA